MSADGREGWPAAGPGTRTFLTPRATQEISGALNGLLADVFAIFLKTKNFHWHVAGPHFRDHHLLLDAQSQQLLAITDAMAERVRKIGGTTLRSVSHVRRLQRVLDNDADYVAPLEMLNELGQDNVQLASAMRDAHRLCSEHTDVASAGMLETWIDEAEERAWFLLQASQPAENGL